jgi:hypothetical protein
MAKFRGQHDWTLDCAIAIRSFVAALLAALIFEHTSHFR